MTLSASDAAARQLQRLRPRLVEQVAQPRRRLEDRATVALTFDDGPHPHVTPRLVELLANHHARATFFLVGERARERPDLVRLLLDAGHAVGSHSRSHPDPWLVGPSQILRDYRSGVQDVRSAAGRDDIRLFRPPKGHLDLRGAAICRLLGLRPWLWTVDSEDWKPGVRPAEILTRTQEVEGGDVLLFHDGLEQPLDARALDRSATLQALPEVIRRLADQGLKTVVLPDS